MFTICPQQLKNFEKISPLALYYFVVLYIITAVPQWLFQCMFTRVRENLCYPSGLR